MYELNITQIKEVLEKAKRIGKSVLILGPSGVGKSVGVAQFAKQFKDGMVDFRLVDKEPTDVGGVLIPTQLPNGEMKSVWALPDMWPTDENWEGVIFLDELSNANDAVQSAAYQIALDRKINSYEFPKGAVIVAAGNRSEDGGSSNAILAPLLNRFIVVHVKPDLDQWLEDFAPYNNIHPVVVQYLKANSEEFFTWDKVKDEENKQFATARSWEVVSDFLWEMKSKDFSIVDKAMVAGMIGEDSVPGLVETYQDLTCLPDINKILDGSLKNFEFKNSSYIFASCYSGMSKIFATLKDGTVEEVGCKVGNYVLFFQNEHNVRQNTDLVVGMVNKMLKHINQERKEVYFHLANNSDHVIPIIQEYNEILAA